MSNDAALAAFKQGFVTCLKHFNLPMDGATLEIIKHYALAFNDDEIGHIFDEFDEPKPGAVDRSDRYSRTAASYFFEDEDDEE